MPARHDSLGGLMGGRWRSRREGQTMAGEPTDLLGTGNARLMDKKMAVSGLSVALLPPKIFHGSSRGIIVVSIKLRAYIVHS